MYFLRLCIQVDSNRILRKTQATSSLRLCIFDLVSWGCPNDVWEKMLIKEQKYTHSKSFMERHPRIQPRMRTILLDWLLEVCIIMTMLYCHDVQESVWLTIQWNSSSQVLLFWKRNSSSSSSSSIEYSSNTMLHQTVFFLQRIVTKSFSGPTWFAGSCLSLISWMEEWISDLYATTWSGFVSQHLGERGVHSSPADVLPGAGLLRQVYAEPRGRGEGPAAADRNHLAFHRLENWGNASSWLEVLWPSFCVILQLLCYV